MMRTRRSQLTTKYTRTWTRPYDSVTIHKSFTDGHFIWHARTFLYLRKLKLIGGFTDDAWCVDDAGDTNNKKRHVLIICSKTKYKTAVSTLWQQVDAMGRRPIFLRTNFVHLRTIRASSFRHIVIGLESTERRKPRRPWMRPRRPQRL